MSAAKCARYLESLTPEGLKALRGAHFMKTGHYTDDFELCRWALDTGYAHMSVFAPQLPQAGNPNQTAKQAARSGIDITGKKMRIVFGKGRDLNIFNVQTMNVDGQWWRITDGDGHLYVVDPKKVNYTETK